MLTFRRPAVLFNVDDPGAATPPEPVAPPELTGPWANDLTEFFDGKESITTADVDRFMAEKYQPYVTRLEQEAAPAKALLKDLNEDFDGTMAALVHQVYEDEDLAERFLKLVRGGATPDEAEAQVAEEAQAAVAAELDPELQEIVEERKLNKQRTAYQEAVDALKATVNDPEFDDEDFSPFVVTAEGDLDRAYAGYKAWRDKAKARWAPAAETPEVPAPPAPLGTSTTGEGAPTPPIQKKYSSLDDALDDFMDEDRAARQAPTTVGTV